jgi:hypothetical protein
MEKSLQKLNDIEYLAEGSFKENYINFKLGYFKGDMIWKR